MLQRVYFAAGLKHRWAPSSVSTSAMRRDMKTVSLRHPNPSFRSSEAPEMCRWGFTIAAMHLVAYERRDHGVESIVIGRCQSLKAIPIQRFEAHRNRIDDQFTGCLVFVAFIPGVGIAPAVQRRGWIHFRDGSAAISADIDPAVP